MIKIIFLTVVLIAAVSSQILFADDVQYIADPKPTHVEKQYKKLIKIKEITENIDGEHFFAVPRSLAVDDKGNLFVFDSKLVKIFKFNKHFKIEKVFLSQGVGPGETYNFQECRWKLYFSKNGKLYFNSTAQKKLIEFDSDGKFIRDIRLPFYAGQNFHPVVDKNQNYYSLSSNGAVDVYDKELIKKYTLLDLKEYKKFFIFKPGASLISNMTRPDEGNTFYDTLANDGFIIYLTNSSTVYIFKNNRLIKQFPLRPQKALDVFKGFIRDMEKETDRRDWFFPFAWNFFVDKDDENYFYIDCRGAGDKCTLYKFNLAGELECVLYKKGPTHFMAKRNNLFYGIDRGTIHIYKEE